jgi:small-conductance mechanosensitive channel
MLLEIGQALWGETTRLADAIALAPSPNPTPKTINTDGILNFFIEKIVPILLAVLGVIFIGRASKGEVSRVLTSSAIAIIGLAFVAGAASLFFFGDSLVKLLFN